MKIKQPRNPFMIFKKNNLFIVVCCAFITCMYSCDKDDDNPSDAVYDRIKPSGPAPSWGTDIAPQMLAVIETLDTIVPNPIHTLTPAAARAQPTPADAVMRVMSNFNVPTPPFNVDTSGRNIPVSGGQIHLRIYTPKTGKTKYPVIVYYHGGGWVIATIDTYNSSAQNLAEKANAIVVSVEYRKGPEHKFPTAHNDAFAAYKWALANAGSFNGDSTKTAVAGESAGGNLAITVGMMARDSSVRLPVYAISVYPVAANDPNTPSKIQYAEAHPLSTPDLPWFLGYYLNNNSEAASPLIDLVNANLSGLPPTTIIAAEIDPLQSEGKTLADKLQAAGVSVNYKLYQGVTHEFFGMSAVVPQAEDAEDDAASDLDEAF